MSNDVYNQALKELKKFNRDSGNNIYIPSLGKEITFKSLTVKQQSDIIAGTLMATSGDNTSAYAYQSVIDEIISTNCSGEELANISSLDRVCILIQLRVLTLGETMEIKGETYNISKHVKTFSEHSFDIQSLEGEVEYEDIKCSCKVPTFLEDYQTNKSASKTYKITNTHEAIGDVFMIELTKYIDSITFGDNLIDFSELTFKQKAQICEMLPMGLSQKIVGYIESARALEEPFVQISVEGEDTIEIPIDAQLFDK